MSEERLPWRYRCPACGSALVHRYSLKLISTTREAGWGRRIVMSGHKGGIVSPLPRYWCKGCGARFDTPRDMLTSYSLYSEMISARAQPGQADPLPGRD